MLWQYSDFTFPFLIILGIVVGVLLIIKKVKILKLDKKSFDRLLMIFAFSGAAFYIGARLFDDLFHYLNGEVGHKGGITFMGGMISAVVVFVILFFIFLKPIRRKFFLILNIIVMGITIGHSIGRVGCFLSGCCYGKVTTSVIGVTFPGKASVVQIQNLPFYQIKMEGSDAYYDLFVSKLNEDGHSLKDIYKTKEAAEFELNRAKEYAENTKLIPTQIIESLFLLALFFLMLAINKLQTHIYLIGYGVYRFFAEFLRFDNRGAIGLGISPSQLISIIIVFVGIISLITFLILKKKNLIDYDVKLLVEEKEVIKQ